MQDLFHSFAHRVANLAGRPLTFALALALIILWALCGPIFGFSETWQLVVNTATTIITFLMVFVLQNSQNRDGVAVQAKLDELIFALKTADNSFVAAEDLSDEELKTLRAKLADKIKAATEELEERSVTPARRKSQPRSRAPQI